MEIDSPVGGDASNSKAGALTDGDKKVTTLVLEVTDGDKWWRGHAI